MAADTRDSVDEACRIQAEWLAGYPSDYEMLDLGESLWMLADAVAATERWEAEARVSAEAAR